MSNHYPYFQSGKKIFDLFFFWLNKLPMSQTNIYASLILYIIKCRTLCKRPDVHFVENW